MLESMPVSWPVSPLPQVGSPSAIPGCSRRPILNERQRHSLVACESADEREGLHAFPKVELCEPLAENSSQFLSRNPDGQHPASIRWIVGSSIMSTPTL